VNLGAEAMARFDPYENNGGTCVAVAGADYCVVAADTRLSVGYSILSRDHSKIAQLADKCVLASSGFQGDIKALQKNLAAKELVYEHNHNKKIRRRTPTPAACRPELPLSKASPLPFPNRASQIRISSSGIRPESEARDE